MNPVILRSRFWSDLTSEEFSRLDRERLIAVLPVGATEQHGPHLPMSTDTATIDGMVRATLPHLPDDLPVLFLPHGALRQEQRALALPGHAHGLGQHADRDVDRHRRLRGACRRAQAGALQQPRRPDERDGHRGARPARGARDDGGGRQLVHAGPARGPVHRARGQARHPRRRPRELGDAAPHARLRARRPVPQLPLDDRGPRGREQVPLDHAQRQARLADARHQPDGRGRRRHPRHRREGRRGARPRGPALRRLLHEIDRFPLSRLANEPAWR